MQRLCYIAAMVLSLVVIEPARACLMSAPIVLDDVKYADVVLVGRISNYRIIRDQEFRRRMLSRPDLPENLRRAYEDQTILMTDYARFDIQVDEVLVGRVPNSLTVTWDVPWENPNFTGPFLIALRQPNSPMPLLRGPSGTVFAHPEAGSLTVLQAPCSGPFIFESTGNEGRVIRRILDAEPHQE